MVSQFRLITATIDCMLDGIEFLCFFPFTDETESSTTKHYRHITLSKGLSKYGPWGYLILGMLLCGGALLVCVLWGKCAHCTHHFHTWHPFRRTHTSNHPENVMPILIEFGQVTLSKKVPLPIRQSHLVRIISCGK